MAHRTTCSTPTERGRTRSRESTSTRSSWAALGLVLDRGGADSALEGPLGGEDALDAGAQRRPVPVRQGDVAAPRLRRVRWRTLEPQRTERTRRWVKWGSWPLARGRVGVRRTNRLRWEQALGRKSSNFKLLWHCIWGFREAGHGKPTTCSAKRTEFGQNRFSLGELELIELRLPEDCDRGPRINRPQLQEAGRVSDPAFDLWLGLAYLWDEAKMSNGGRRVYATRPKAKRDKDGCLIDAHGRRILRADGSLVRDWRHARAVLDGFERHPHADKVPWLDTKQIRRLAYGGADSGQTKQQRSRELRTTLKLLRKHEREGRIVIEMLVTT